MIKRLVALFCFAAVLALNSPVDAEEVRLKTGGQSLSASLTLAGGKTLQDDIVLITHGTLAHSKMEIIATLQRLLNEAGYSSLAINLALGAPHREFLYDCKLPHRHIFHDAMSEIGAWLDWLQMKGSKRVVLMGHSRGGNQTAWFAAEAGHKLVKKIVLLAPSIWSAEQSARSYQKFHHQALADVLEKAQALADQGKGDTMIRSGFFYCRGADVSAATFLSYYGPDERRNSPKLLADIQKPMLIMAGSEDNVVVGLADIVPQYLKEKTQRFEIIDGAGHFFRDLYAEDVVDLIVEFIAD